MVSFGYVGDSDPKIESVSAWSVIPECSEDRFIDIEDDWKEVQHFEETCAGEVFSLFSRVIIVGSSSSRRGGMSPTFQFIAGVHSAIQYFLPLCSYPVGGSHHHVVCGS